MSTRIRSHLRSNVVGYIALFMALGGTAYAANTVGSADVIDNSLVSADLADNSAVGTLDVINDTAPRGGLFASDLAANSVGASEVAPAAIASSELALNAVPADGTANDGSTKLATNSVDYDEIAGGAVRGPSVLNDGLTGADLNESTLDSNVVQKRINGTCAAWESIRSVSSTGSVFCSHGPAAFSAHDDYTGIICNDFCTEGTLSVPAGIYAVSAQIQGDNSLAAGADFFVQCRLSAGDDVNYARFYSHNNSLAATTLPMQLVHWFTSAGKVAVDCEDLGFGDVSGGALRITAISLGSVSNVQSNSG